jgi:single-strand DNA-binding protein
MSANMAVYGRLTGDPKAIDTKTGKSMTVATLAVDVGEADAPPLWLGLVAFGRLADELLRHHKGDTLSASGRVQVRQYAGSDGAQREQWQVVADALVSARTVRPGARKAAPAGDDGRPFDDPL